MNTPNSTFSQPTAPAWNGKAGLSSFADGACERKERQNKALDESLRSQKNFDPAQPVE